MTYPPPPHPPLSGNLGILLPVLEKFVVPDKYKKYWPSTMGLGLSWVVGFNNAESTQQWTFSDYQVVGGIRKAMKIEIKRDGEPFQKIEVIDFKVMDKVNATVFGG